MQRKHLIPLLVFLVTYFGPKLLLGTGSIGLPGTGLHVFILRDFTTEADLSREVLASLQSSEALTLLNTKCGKDETGSPAWRSWDDSHTPEEITDADVWKQAYQKALTDSKGSRPWLLYWNNGRGVSKPMPKETDYLAELKGLK